MQLVIIGASFAGISCALMARKRHPHARITLLERQPIIGYLPNGLNWLYQGRIARLEDAVRWQVANLQAQEIDVQLESEVVAVDRNEKYVELLDGRRFAYDHLVLAMGAKQQSNYIVGADHPLVVTTKELVQSQHAKKIIDHSQHIVIVGGGLMGLEASETYMRMGKQVTLIEAMDLLEFKNFDAALSNTLLQRAVAEGLSIQLEQRAVEIMSHGTKRVAVQTEKQQFIGDAVLLCVNFRPNSSIVSNMLTCNIDQTIAVNEYLQTSDPAIFAVGDLITIPIVHQPQRCYVPMITHAMHTGEIAACNLVSQQRVLMPVVHKVTGHVFGLFVASVGLTAEEASYYQDIQVHAKTAADRTVVYLVTDDQHTFLLGAQILSPHPIDQAVDFCAMIIERKKPLAQVEKPEEAELPIIQLIWDVLQQEIKH